MEKVRIRDPGSTSRIRNTEGQVPSQESQDTIEKKKNSRKPTMFQIRTRSGLDPDSKEEINVINIMIIRELEAPLGAWNVFF